MNTFRESVKGIKESNDFTSFKKIGIFDRANKIERMNMYLHGVLQNIKKTYSNDLSSYENKTFNAVPKPTV